METSLNYALITGSSSGLGKSFAMQLADRGYNLVLVAFADDHLLAAAQEIREKYPIDVKELGVDLSKIDAAEEVASWVEEQNIKIDILINNVGVGYVSNFLKMPLEYYEKLVNLNAIVMMKLTYLLLPNMMTNGHTHILNIGSIASLFPAPYKAIYSASKHFVKSFSFSLREELKGSVSVTVAFPAGILSNEESLERAKSFGWLARLGLLQPDKVARQCLRAMFRRRRKVLPGNAPFFYSRIKNVLGYDLTIRLLKKNFEKEIKKQEEELAG